MALRARSISSPRCSIFQESLTTLAIGENHAAPGFERLKVGPGALAGLAKLCRLSRFLRFLVTLFTRFLLALPEFHILFCRRLLAIRGLRGTGQRWCGSADGLGIAS